MMAFNLKIHIQGLLVNYLKCHNINTKSVSINSGRIFILWTNWLIDTLTNRHLISSNVHQSNRLYIYNLF